MRKRTNKQKYNYKSFCNSFSPGVLEYFNNISQVLLSYNKLLEKEAHPCTIYDKFTISDLSFIFDYMKINHIYFKEHVCHIREEKRILFIGSFNDLIEFSFFLGNESIAIRSNFDHLLDKIEMLYDFPFDNHKLYCAFNITDFTINGFVVYKFEDCFNLLAYVLVSQKKTKSQQRVCISHLPNLEKDFDDLFETIATFNIFAEIYYDGFASHARVEFTGNSQNFVGLISFLDESPIYLKFIDTCFFCYDLKFDCRYKYKILRFTE